MLNWSLQNVGLGCATETTVVVRIYNDRDHNEQIGSDVPMGSLGGLYARTIRPDEIVPLTSQRRVGISSGSGTVYFQGFPTWTDVRCS